MAKTTMRIQLNRAAVRLVLQGKTAPAVTAKLLSMGSAIARSAEGAAPGAVFTVNSHVGANRFRVTVGTGNKEARLAEATDRALTLAINAGRM